MSRRKKILAYTVKLLIGILCFLIIYSKIRINEESKQLVFQALSDSQSLLLIFSVCALMPLNWGIESYKWKLITNSVEPISFGKAFQSVFAGVCVGNLAPGRSTEFLAKVLFFKPEHRAVVSLLHFVNGIFQLLVTIAAGVLALCFSYSAAAGSGYMIYLIFILAITLITLFTLVIVKFEWLQVKLFSLRWFQKHKPAHTISLQKKNILALLTLSLTRYVLFAIQFYILLICFHIHLGPSKALSGIAVYFLLTSMIPMISIIEPAIRAAIALFVFNTGESHSFQLIAASTMLWFINIVLPSIIGYLIILKEKFIIKTSLR